MLDLLQNADNYRCKTGDMIGWLMGKTSTAIKYSIENHIFKFLIFSSSEPRIRHATTYLLDVGVYIRTTYFYSNNFSFWNTGLNWTVNKRDCDRSFDQENHQEDWVWFHRIGRLQVLSNQWSIPILERFLQALFHWQTW